MLCAEVANAGRQVLLGGLDNLPPSEVMEANDTQLGFLVSVPTSASTLHSGDILSVS